MRNRVKELRIVKASSINKHPLNFRKHPQDQSDAMRHLLEKIGYAGAIIAREDGDTGLTLIDGHLRVELAGDEEVPVLIVDLSEDEANKLLASYDQVTGMAEIDGDILAELCSEIGEEFFLDNAAMRKMFADMDFESSVGGDERKALDKEFNHEVTGMQLKPHEHYDYLVVLARDTHSWNRLCDLLGLKAGVLLGGRPTKKKIAKNRMSKIGISRAILADDLIQKLEGDAKH